MNLMGVMTEMGLALATIDGIRVQVVGAAAKVETPGTGATALVPYPRRKTYSATYARGMDAVEAEFVIVVPDPTRRVTVEKITRYADGAGDTSVKAALDGYAWTTCDGCNVESAEFDVMQFAGTDYMAVIFTASLWGSGTQE